MLKRLFNHLGAPLAGGSIPSWGAVDKKGFVYLTAWRDQILRIDHGRRLAQINWHSPGEGFSWKREERWDQIEKLLEGNAGFIVLLEADDIMKRPRKIHRVETHYIYQIGDVFASHAGSAAYAEMIKKVVTNFEGE